MGGGSGGVSAALAPFVRLGDRLAIPQRLPDALVQVSDRGAADLFAVLVLEHRLVDLELLQQVQVCSGLGHVALDDPLDLLLLQRVGLVVVSVLIGDPVQDLVDQRGGVDEELGVGGVEVLQELHDVVPRQNPLVVVHGLHGLDQEHAVAFRVLHEDQEQFQRGLDHQSELGRDQAVQPLDGLVVVHHSIHPIHIQHHLPQRPQDVVLVVLVGLGAHLDQTRQSIILHELVDEILVFLEDLLEGEEGAAQLAAFRSEQFLDDRVDPHRQLRPQNDRVLLV
jgi:hypothetical protein